MVTHACNVNNPYKRNTWQAFFPAMPIWKVNVVIKRGFEFSASY